MDNLFSIQEDDFRKISELLSKRFGSYYRSLQTGEVVEWGDEYLLTSGSQPVWKPITLSERIGKVYDPRIHVECRRPVRSTEIMQVVEEYLKGIREAL